MQVDIHYDDKTICYHVLKNNNLTSVVLDKIGGHVCWDERRHFMVLLPHLLYQKFLLGILC
jgi:hypothetical protein